MNHSISILALLLFALIFVFLIVAITRRLNVRDRCDDDFEDDLETTTTTTTTTTEAGREVQFGLNSLERQTEGKQFYVIDPSDGEKIWVNSNDDLYEDASGKIWRLKC